jgi:hypothetical protein
MRLAGFAVVLYLACVAAFVLAHVATVTATGGEAEAATAILRGAIVCVPIALLGMFIWRRRA